MKQDAASDGQSAHWKLESPGCTGKSTEQPAILGQRMADCRILETDEHLAGVGQWAGQGVPVEIFFQALEIGKVQQAAGCKVTEEMGSFRGKQGLIVPDAGKR